MPITKKMKKVSLHAVINLAFRNKKFLNALLKNPAKAVKARSLTMSERDMANLIVRVDYARRIKRMKNFYLTILKGGKPCAKILCAWYDGETK